ncbi:MAG: ice-binding family protein [Bacteroidota bacterium]
MKKQLLHIVTSVTLLSLPAIHFAQAPNLGSTVNYVLFSTNGAVTNTGISQLTGNVGTSMVSSTGFGNVNGVMNNNNGSTSAASTDLITAYNQLDNTVFTSTLAPALGGGQTLTSGVYAIASAASLNQGLTLDGLGSASSVFIFKIAGPLSTATNSKVKLINGALACNVFWKVEGLVDMAAGTSMKGTIIANNAAINMNTGDTLEGRALSITGAISTDGVLAYTPIGCGSPSLNGPVAPDLGTTACFSIFSANGYVTNTGNTHLDGDVGTNVGLTTGYNALFVGGMIHPINDGATSACAADLLLVDDYLLNLPYDIELLYPAQFGRSLVLTPHTYVMNAAATLTDTLYLNAGNNANGVFVIKINGALSTSTYAKVKLINGAQAKNVFWKVNGAVEINNFSNFKGTIISKDGAVSLKKGVVIDGRALTTSGEFTTDSIKVTLPPTTCASVGINNLYSKITNSPVFYPNPMASNVTVTLNEASQSNSSELSIYNSLGSLVMIKTLTEKSTTIETEFPTGLYFYKVTNKNKEVQSGRLIAQ